MQLIVNDPQPQSDRFIATYEYDGDLFTYVFALPAQLPAGDPIATRFMRWTALIHAAYLFSIDYMDQIVTNFELTDFEISFFEKTIFLGMAEFRYVNSIAITTPTSITPRIALQSATRPATTQRASTGALLLNGGGKDGLTSGLLLQEAGYDFDLFQVGTGTAQSRTARVLQRTPHVAIRTMDARQFTGQYSGHRPTSAAIAILACFSAYLLGKRDVIASNESSADEINLQLDKVPINHQFSKSFIFEHAFAELLQRYDMGVRYFSLLRPLTELQITKIFSTRPEFATAFISCNHGFRKGYWCKQCAKCAFISLVFNAIAPTIATHIFADSHMLNHPELQGFYEELVTPEAAKPLECIGTIEECQMAAALVLKQPQLPSLNAPLRHIFEQQTQHLSRELIVSTLRTIGHQHAIPQEYSAVIRLFNQKLAA